MDADGINTDSQTNTSLAASRAPARAAAAMPCRGLGTNAHSLLRLARQGAGRLTACCPYPRSRDAD